MPCMRWRAKFHHYVRPLSLLEHHELAFRPTTVVLVTQVVVLRLHLIVGAADRNYAQTAASRSEYLSALLI